MKPGIRTHSITDPQGLRVEVARLFISEVTREQLDIDGVENLRDIRRVLVEPEHRRKGYAKALLAKVCMEADETGCGLYLHPMPFDDKPMGGTALRALYKRFGFKQLPEELQPEVVMVRPCKGRS